MLYNLRGPMDFNIYILTMGRPHKQLTYNLLPDFLKEKVIFVIRDFEVEYFKDKNYKVCPEWVTNVSTTRKYIQQLAGDSYHWVMDDDLKELWFRPFDPLSDKPWAKTLATEQDWINLCKDIEQKIKDGFGLIGFTTTGRIPSDKRHPFREGLCGISWFCVNGKLTKHLDWNRQELAEDYNAMFQAITSGVRIGRYECYVTAFGVSNAPGGVSNHRTEQKLSQCHIQLISEYPKYVKPSRVCKNYGTKGMEKVNVFFIKAYKDYAPLREKCK